MSSKVILGSAALLTGALIYERNKSPTGPVTPDDLQHWKSSQYNTEYPTRRSSVDYTGNEKSSLKSFAKEVDAGQYDGRQRLFEHGRKQSHDLGDAFRIHDESSLRNIKQGVKEDLSSLKNALVGKTPNYTDATQNVKNNFKDDYESLKSAVVNTKDDVKNYAKDTWGNKSALQEQLGSAESKVNELKKQLNSLDSTDNYTHEEIVAINKNKNIMSGFGENAAFFANEQYEDVNGSPTDRFNTKDLRVGMLDSNGKKLTQEDINRIQRNAMRGYGENATFFAEEQYEKGKQNVSKLASDGADKIKSAWENTKDIAEDKKDDIKDAWNSTKSNLSSNGEEFKDNLDEAKQNVNQKASSWWSWGSKKADEAGDKAKENLDWSKQKAKENIDWSKEKTSDALDNTRNGVLDAADKTLDYASRGFSSASKSLEEQRDFINDKKN
ncbi:hypothetical protein AWRI3578_g2256 [Hanseniaspora opuntiae]|uniref:Mitochondrial outer membrane protein OM45 n=1 Tax=Hanseniaspora opuntiae TaxID=211096 RepID=A0A1E5RMU0_9ASCO|nr:hypothetical protein AWRI3578_g2256 [Hanseniaspora opuntiae]